ncbi:hypothetical protein MPSEU_000850100 [Mayamaea pseudoterrestris]|nr:hypothetical protein MPSEU_000850100 [Mayamaea pseudoterrestris]
MPPQVFLDALPIPASIPVIGPPPKPCIDISALSSVTLGANPFTGIAPSSGLDPAVCLVHAAMNAPLVDAANGTSHLQVQGAQEKSMYFINNVPFSGTMLRTLKHGDVLALKCSNGHCHYSYQVRIQESASFFNRFKNASPKSQAAAAAASLESAATAAAHANSTAHPATEECFCPYCLEIQVQSTTLVPCGHAFCKECVSSCNECPTCRTAVQSQVPCRTVDNIIHSMVKSNFFSADDAQVYEERRADVVEIEPIAVVHPLTRPTKRQRRNRANKAPTVVANGGDGSSEATAIAIDDD